MEYTLQQLVDIKAERWQKSCKFEIATKSHLILDYLGKDTVLGLYRIYKDSLIEIKRGINDLYEYVTIFFEDELVYHQEFKIFRDGDWRYHFDRIECDAKQSADKQEKIKIEAKIQELRKELGL